MSHTTAQMWPDETPEEVVARTRREHGDAVADIVARSFGFTPPRKRSAMTRWRVGVKPAKPPKALRPPSRGMTREQASAAWTAGFNASNEKNKGRPGFNASGLPRSGARRGPV